MKTKPAGTNASPENDEILKALDALAPGSGQSSHVPDEDLGAYAEVVMNAGLPAAEQRFTSIARHLKLCDACAGTYLDLLAALQLPAASRAEGVRNLDLSFLQAARGTWQSLGDDLWELTEAIRLEIQEVRLQVKSSLAGLSWKPALLPVRRAKGKQPSSSAGDLVIPWPEQEFQIVLGITQVMAGVQVTAVALESGSLQKIDEIEAFMVDDTRSRTYQGRRIEAGVLDFGILPPGTYHLRLTYHSAGVVIPIEIVGQRG